jgi:leucyl/phenylalanyl-tRNA--protein transferase
MHYLDDNIQFPDVSKATKVGLLAIGGDLSAERLILAYKSGIFPWYEENEPILWWSPDPRFVLYPEKLKVSKSMRQLLGQNKFKVTFNKAFEDVIKKCSVIDRTGQYGTWITTSMVEAYCKLHVLGYAKSVEVWQNNNLVGGLYGIDLGNSIFCGESMFAEVSNASKVGFITFVQQNNYNLIDCQLHTSHLESLGGEEISRNEFINLLN